jgi:hypothetical protein
MLSLIVKGDRFQAAYSAAERGIPFVFRNEVPFGTQAVNTVGLVPSGFITEVIQWFCESNHVSPENYLQGTLLFYATTPTSV